jgi:hypothetical protein
MPAAEMGSRARCARPFARRLLDQDQRAHQRSRFADRARHHTGQNHDVTGFPALMLEVDCDPRLLLGEAKATTAMQRLGTLPIEAAKP